MTVRFRWAGWTLLALLAACGGASTSVDAPAIALGTRVVAPGCGYEHVYVTVDRVLVERAAGSVEVALPAPRRIDLMSLDGGVLAALGAAPLPAGDYRGLRLFLAANGPGGDASNAVLPAGGALAPLDTPGAQHGGLKLRADFEVPSQALADVSLQASEACGSVTSAGNSGHYLLGPVIAAQPIDATLLAKGEFRVNTAIAGDQSFPAIAALANGGYVVAWMSSTEGGAGTSVLSQRYDRRGAPQGGETSVAPGTATDTHQYPRVAGLKGGGHVVVWTTAGPGYVTQAIYAQRFDATGAAVGAATRVSPDTLAVAITPAVAALADGGFLVTWSADFASIDARRYDRDGNALGSPARINLTAGGAWQSAVTGLADGGYAAAWGLLPVDVPPPDVYTRRFDAGGLPVGSETRANTFTADAQQQPDIAALRDGGYVVAWMSQYQDGSGYGIYAQRFGSGGAPSGSELQVNTATPGSQESPAVAALADGGWVVAWFDGDIHAQRFDSNGAPVGAQARVNTAALSSAQPAITALPNGGYVVAWQSWTQDGSGYGVYAQQFDADGLAR